MKKLCTLLMMFFASLTMIMAQDEAPKKAQAEITFEKTTHDFGTFSENDPRVTCVFKFKNTGNNSEQKR